MIITIILALIFAVMGIAIKYYKCYWLISGYNTASQKQKEKVDIVGLGNFLGTSLLGISVIILLSAILRYLGYDAYSSYMMLLIIPSVIFMVLRTEKYQNFDRSIKYQRWVLIGILLIILSLVGLLITSGAKGNPVEITQDYLKIKGNYSTILSLDEINDIKLVDTMPRVNKKINGFNFGHDLKGEFTLENQQRVRLYVHSKSSPFVLLEHQRGPVYINYRDSKRTRELYNSIKNHLKN